MSERLEPVTHVLHTAIGHETDGDMGSDAPACPMKDRSDSQIVLVGAKSAFDVPQLTVLVQQFGGAELIVAPGDDGVDAVPARGLCHFLLIDRGLAVRWNVEKPRMSFRHQAERLCASLQALEQLLQRPLSAVAVFSRPLL